MSLASPALAGRFFTTSTTWEPCGPQISWSGSKLAQKFAPVCLSAPFQALSSCFIFTVIICMSHPQDWGVWGQGPTLLHFVCLQSSKGFPGSASDKEPACQCRRCKRCRFDPWIRKISWRRAWQPPLVFLPGEPHGPRGLVGYIPWDHRESDATRWPTHTHTHTHTSLPQ